MGILTEALLVIYSKIIQREGRRSNWAWACWRELTPEARGVPRWRFELLIGSDPWRACTWNERATGRRSPRPARTPSRSITFPPRARWRGGLSKYASLPLRAPSNGLCVDVGRRALFQAPQAPPWQITAAPFLWQVESGTRLPCFPSLLVCHSQSSACVLSCLGQNDFTWISSFPRPRSALVSSNRCAFLICSSIA